MDSDYNWWNDGGGRKDALFQGITLEFVGKFGENHNRPQ
jgi:hypothetical protein